jgi:DNA replication initiation complex subunit (GINS family)
MDDEEFLEKAKALAGAEDLSEDEKKLVERVLALLRDEKKVLKKDRLRIAEIHKDLVGNREEDADPNEDIDEDDFV